MTWQTAVLHLFAVSCLHDLENVSHIPSSFRILTPNWKVPGIFIFPVFRSSSVSFLSFLQHRYQNYTQFAKCVCSKVLHIGKIMLSVSFTRQHWDRPDIILNKSAWHHLQEMYVMGLSKLSSSSVFNLFFTLLLHTHIPPSQVHTAPIFLLHSHFPAVGKHRTLHALIYCAQNTAESTVKKLWEICTTASSSS